MKRIHSVLAATDFSSPARDALMRAAGLSRVLEVPLTLLHVVSEGAISELRQLLGAKSPPVEARLLDAARSELEALAQALSSTAGVTLPASLLATGAPLQAILTRAESVSADLLVLGAKGQSFMRHILLGSTAERLLRRSRTPMLVVKQPAAGDYQRVLLPVDFSSWSLEALLLAREVAPRAQLTLLHAFEVPFEGKLRFAGVEEYRIAEYVLAAKRKALADMQGLAAQAGMDTVGLRMIAFNGDAWRHILEQETELDCDLIVLGKHGRNAAEELLLGSVTRHVLSSSRCDVLVSAAGSQAAG